MKILFLFLLLLVCPAIAADLPTVRVGQPLVLEEIYIPGGEVRPIPRRDREPSLIVQILDIRPAKDGSRYDLEIQGLDPGIHDIAGFLRRVGAPEEKVIPPLKIEITTAIPEGPPRATDLPKSALPEVGGYKMILIGVSVIWLIGLGIILFWRKKKAPVVQDSAPPPSVAERLRPLVAAASEGKLSAEDRANLDRLVVAHWRSEILELKDLSAGDALVFLRKHPESAPLLLALEQWIHAPAQTEPENITELLLPYA